MGDQKETKQQNTIPAGFIKATVDDFNTQGRRKIGMVFWLHSYHYPELQRYTLNENTNPKTIQPWFDDDRVYIYKGSEPEKYLDAEKITLKTTRI